MTYASDTRVKPDRSRDEIERTLERYGATGFAYGWDQDRAMVGFTMGGRQVRFVLELPARDDPQFSRTPGRGYMRSNEQTRAAWEQAVRQRWRALALVVKAKLEAVEAGISSFDEEFLANLVLPGGQTVAASIMPAIANAYRTGHVGPLLPMLVAPVDEGRAVVVEVE